MKKIIKKEILNFSKSLPKIGAMIGITMFINYCGCSIFKYADTSEELKNLEYRLGKKAVIEYIDRRRKEYNMTIKSKLGKAITFLIRGDLEKKAMEDYLERKR